MRSGGTNSDCKVSPAVIIYGRQLQDGFVFLNKLDKFSNPAVRPVWREAWKLKEEALRTRFVKNSEAINHKARKLRPLYVGSRCLLQNQSGNHPQMGKKWSCNGGASTWPICCENWWLTETRRNRRFLRLYNPISTSIDAKEFYGWRQDQPSAQEDDVSHQSPDSPLMFPDDSKEQVGDIDNARIDSL